MQCFVRTAWGKWAVEHLQYSASLPGGSGQRIYCNALPQCLGVRNACKLVQYAASPPRGSGQWNSCSSMPLSRGQWEWSSWSRCNAVLLCLGAVGSASLVLHRLAARRQRAVQLLQYTTSLPGGSGQCNSCKGMPHCLGGSGQCNFCNALPYGCGAVGSGTPATHYLTAWGQWAMQLLQYIASLPGGSGQWNSRGALPQSLGAEGCGIPAMHCLTARGAVGSGTTAIHCPSPSGAVGTATRAIHCLTASGQRA